MKFTLTKLLGVGLACLTLSANSWAQSQSDAPAPANETRLQSILSSELLKVCIWPDYYSISYRDPRSQQ